MTYKFFGFDNKDVSPIKKEFSEIKNQRVLYDYLSKIWSKETCAPRLREKWTKENNTVGQCSITAFLVQDIFGGKVYGVPLSDGGVHCYNVIGEVRFDLTSEQFNEKLNYEDKYEQSREEHFSKDEKYQRYLLLKRKLIELLLTKRNENMLVKEDLSSSQEPYMMVISCSDSRVVPELIFNSSFNEMFVIRTAGNVINEGELASIEYGIEHLNIKYILLLAHTNCGAVHASIKNEKGKYLDPVLNRIHKNIGNIINEREASLVNAKKEIEYLKTKFTNKDLIFDYALYDLKTNKVIFDERI
ncbi:MAG: hypothetical protein J6M95_04745 [Bacilli bacterium]|nr:hypothetical protein [Bacilli bacterium]